MRHLLFPSALAGLLALPTPAQVAQATSSETAWEGEWRLLPGESDQVEPLIETHVKGQNFAMRLLWKHRLATACRAYPHLDILLGQVYTVTFGKEVPADAPMDGTPGTWKRSDGETFRITVKREDPRITQVLQGNGYTLTNLFSLGEDGALDLRVTYSSPKLANPFVYRLVYKKTD